jgi:hypothetical protein
MLWRSATKRALLSALTLILFCCVFAQVEARSRREVGESLPLKAFFGKYVGQGLADEHILYIGVTERELAVAIEPTGDGFAITWTTQLRQDNDPNNEKTKIRASKMTFVPSGRPNLWRLDKQGDPLKGEPFAWTRIDGDALVTTAISFDADGHFEVETYWRSVNAAGMEVDFTRSKEGVEVLSVGAKLEPARQ